MHRTNRWNICPPSEAAEQLAACLKTSPLIAHMLINRGIAGPEDCQRFLSPSLKHLHDPGDIANLKKAAERIAKAIRDGEKIVVYGDYDVDGITATAILWHAIKLLGGQIDYYIPHRLEEGYGLNAEAIEQICDAGAKLIITVDCGVTAVEEARVACERGVDMIITDHHEWKHSPDEKAILPECFTVVHPRLPRDDGSPYPNPNLCGAGVAFKLAWGVGQAHNGAAKVSDAFRRFLVEATALAALGTIADVVPLVGENRSLAHFGLSSLKQSELTGIKALIESAGLTGQKLDSYHVGFLLAPRLNACGRMGHAREAVEMLTRADHPKAVEIAKYLEQKNRERQAIERKIFEQAMQQVVENGFDKDGCRAVVLGAEGWHPGVIGIVASRIVNRLNRPTVMVALSNGHGQGSARSIPGFHLARALDACRDTLEACGGHEMAAGLRLQTTRFEQFREAFRAYADKEVSDEMLTPELHLDCVAELRQITAAVVQDMQRLGPFGTANGKPLLCCRGVEIAAPPRRVGKTGDHLQILVRQGSVTMKCIAFNRGEIFEQLLPGLKIDLAVEPSINDYNGYRNVELDVKDIRFA
jgi:single-stranded-DNA-specific exonuclease